MEGDRSPSFSPTPAGHPIHRFRQCSPEEMEAALCAASGLIGRVVKLLSEELVGAYVASSQLGLISNNIKNVLMYTHGLLCEAQRRGVADNDGLHRLLQQLTAKADEAEDALDELHYFIIQDQLDGTQHAVPDLGDGPRGHCRHLRHVVRHIVGNCLSCLFCSRVSQDHDEAAVTITNNPPNATKSDSGGNDGLVDKPEFDRVAMSKKIKSVIEDIHSLCEPVSKLLNIVPIPSSNTAIVNLKRPLIGSTAAQDTLYGRRDLLEQTIKDLITSVTTSSKTLSVIPIVGPGGIGKTTFTQHLYNDKRIQEHFPIRVWVCVSTDFDVLKLSQEILSCIEGTNTANQTTSLDQLQISITQKLKSKRFLIVFDDLWECNSQGWENVLDPFKKSAARGSMFLVTTRFPSKAAIVKTTYPIELKGLEPDEFFKFFEAFILEGGKPQYYEDDLANLARDISKKLKGSPLAAKTVGRLLKKKLSQEHWMAVLENNEWQQQQNPDDIMPSLRISYDYLPFHLKKCFLYFGLFPEDYRFRHLEITYFWIAMGIIDKDENYMEELVDNGFLVKENDDWEGQYYVLHELSRSVSSEECLNIYSTVRFRVDAIPKSIRHLSITIEDRYETNFREEMCKLRSKIDIVNLRTLMVFRGYGETNDEILKDIFKQIKGLRVLFIEVISPESLSCDFSKLIHLRLLKISMPYCGSKATLPSTLSKSYHLKFLDLENWKGSENLPKDISRLISLHHLHAGNELHSTVPEVGKMKCLKELKAFRVNKESVGFELSELGELTNLGGKLAIYNLQMVATKEETMKAKLASKGDLKDLRLVWGNPRLVWTFEHRGEEPDVLDGTTEISDVLDGFEPHPNLRSLLTKIHGGSTSPHWLCGDIRVGMLKSLHLEGVSWVTLPPFEQLPHLTSLILRNIYEVCEIRPGFGGATDKSFSQLKQIVLDRLPKLTKWVGVHIAQSFSRLEEIRCIECPNLCALPFLLEYSPGSYNHLTKLEIKSCPKLFLPPMPHTSTLTHVDVFASPSGRMEFKPSNMLHGLTLPGYNSTLAWHNMASKVESITFEAGSRIPWAKLPKLAFLRELVIKEEPSFLSMVLLSNLTTLTCLQLVNCENITLDGYNPLIGVVNLKALKVFNTGDRPCSVAADLLSELMVASRTKILLPTTGCFQLEYLKVDSMSAVLAAPVCSLIAATLRSLCFKNDKRVKSFKEEEENALQLLTSLQELTFESCSGLPSLPQGLHKLSSLRLLFVVRCPEIRSLPKAGIPTSLQDIFVYKCSPELDEQVKKLRGT